MGPKVLHIIERLAALALLVVLAPLFAVLSVVLLVAQGRPIFFSQERAGLGGATFSIHKFRTMAHNASNESHAARVTLPGRILRRLGLDELPQLVNIVLGEMSFIGPRPTLPEQVERYGHYERRRLNTRPGITGWAQVHGRNSIPWTIRILLDVWYVENRTFWLDLQILWRTIGAVMSGRGVYGDGGLNPDFGIADVSRTDLPRTKR